MDKLTNNLFGPGVVLVVLLLLGGGYYLVLSPKGEVKDAGDKLMQASTKLKKLLKEDDLPTDDYVKNIDSAQQEMEANFNKSVEVFSSRCNSFQLFFDDQVEVVGEEFFADYQDAIQDSDTGLRAKYWEKFPIQVVEDKEEDVEKKIPTVEMMKDSEFSGPDSQAKMHQAMKQFWISEAVFLACHELEIGGLQSIEFPVERVRSSRRSTKNNKAAVASKESKVNYTKVEAKIELHMRYSKLKDLLTVLYANQRVPFIEPKRIQFEKIGDSIKDFSKYIRQETFQSQALAVTAEEAGEPAVQEPLVKVQLDLIALDWKGVERVKAGSKDKKAKKG